MSPEVKKVWNGFSPTVKHRILEQVQKLSENPFGSSGYWSNLEEYLETVYLNK